jgi:hypothetical protein
VGQEIPVLSKISSSDISFDLKVTSAIDCSTTSNRRLGNDKKLNDRFPVNAARSGKLSHLTHGQMGEVTTSSRVSVLLDRSWSTDVFIHLYALLNTPYSIQV